MVQSVIRRTKSILPPTCAINIDRSSRTWPEVSKYCTFGIQCLDEEMKEATSTGLYGVGQTLSENQILALTRHRGTV